MSLTSSSLMCFDGLVLGIESSCDETSAAVLDGTSILSNVVSSQVDLHKRWGGVVPEAAARAHVEAIVPVVQEALTQAGVMMEAIGGIAVTNRPGLVGALAIGAAFASAIAVASGKPLIGVHHLEGHILSAALANPHLRFPHLCLIVSGGHTELVEVAAPGHYRLVGQTLDDAAGEAFDKSARLLGLGYPGGRAIQALAASGDPSRYVLPRGLSGNTFDFSFSGLKTAVLRLVQKEADQLHRADAAASIQQAITSVLAERTVKCAQELCYEEITICGGVAANEELRSRLQSLTIERSLRLSIPPAELCTDNAAMIAFAGSVRLAAGERDTHELDVFGTSDLPAWPLDASPI